MCSSLTSLSVLYITYLHQHYCLTFSNQSLEMEKIREQWTRDLVGVSQNKFVHLGNCCIRHFN